MSVPINIKKIRVASFSIESSESLKYGQEVVIGLTAAVNDIHGTDNHDGTQNVTYTAKPIIVRIDRVLESGNITVATTEKAGKSKSKQARAMCYRIGQEIGESEESLYNLYDEAGREAVENHRLSIIGYKDE